ncbi:MAG TPA: hypothetical protein PLJ48_05970, partial [Dermatophilaceae bacterium]|nr:hypothetical protein [Dermatophilaceae bacterium]
MKHIPRRALLAASAAVLLGLAACGGGGSAASTDTAPIKVGIIADLTGATGDVGKPYNEGMMAYRLAQRQGRHQGPQDRGDVQRLRLPGAQGRGALQEVR